MTTAHHCRLHAADGRDEPCPEAACAFWEPGGVALEGRCAFEHLDLVGRPELVPFMLDIRRTLESAETRGEESDAWRRLSHALSHREPQP